MGLWVLSFLIAGSAGFADLSNAEKCDLELAQSQEIRASIERFQKDCRRLPENLAELFNKPKNCRNWAKSGRYMKDKLENPEMLKNFSYDPKAKPYMLLPMHCPN